MQQYRNNRNNGNIYDLRKDLHNVIDSIAFFENGTKTLVEISQFWAGVDSFLWLIGEAVFWLLPVGIVWSITKKMGTTQILGIVLGLTLVSSQLLKRLSRGHDAGGSDPGLGFRLRHRSR